MNTEESLKNNKVFIGAWNAKVEKMGSNEKKQKIPRLNVVNHPAHVPPIKEVTSLKTLLERDTLTGLYNERGFSKAFQEMVESGDSGLLLVLDVNELKILNDALGHQQGDKNLKKTARFLEANTKSGLDIIARPHGDEFYVIFRNIAEDDIDQRMKDFAAIANDNKEHDPFAPSMSVGYVYIDIEESKDMNYWLGRADKAMYEAKKIAKDEGYELLKFITKEPRENITSNLIVGKIKEVILSLGENTSEEILGQKIKRYLTTPTVTRPYNPSNNA